MYKRFDQVDDTLPAENGKVNVIDVKPIMDGTPKNEKPALEVRYSGFYKIMHWAK